MLDRLFSEATRREQADAMRRDLEDIERLARFDAAMKRREARDRALRRQRRAVPDWLGLAFIITAAATTVWMVFSLASEAADKARADLALHARYTASGAPLVSPRPMPKPEWLK